DVSASAADAQAPPPRRRAPRVVRNLRRSRPLRELRRNRGAVASLTFLVLLVVVAVFAPLLAPYDPGAQSLQLRLQGPSVAHPFGTDGFGRDVLSRLIFSARVTLLAIVQALVVAIA